MKTPTLTYQLASLSIALSGVAAIAGAILAGFHTPAPQFLAIGVFALIIAALLRGGRRWLAYIAFLMTSFGAAISYIFWRGSSGIPDWSFEAMMGANLVAALLLFFILWRRKPRRRA